MEDKEIIINSIIQKISLCRFNISNEKVLQQQIFTILSIDFPELIREYKLDKESIIDFYLNGIGIEVKIKGSPKSIYRQLERYSNSEKINVLVLLTSKTLGLPQQINNKPIYYYNFNQSFF